MGKYNEFRYGEAVYDGVPPADPYIGELNLGSLIKLRSLSRTFDRQEEQVLIPRSFQAGYTQGVLLPSYRLSLMLIAETDAVAQRLRRQLIELLGNPDVPFCYVYFGVLDQELDGWFLAGSGGLRFLSGVSNAYPVELTLRRLGLRHSHHLATYWEAESETCAWTLTAQTMVSIPTGALAAMPPVTANRAGSEGNANIIIDPDQQVIRYTVSPTLEDWYKNQCRVYDTVTAGDATEANWEQVFGPAHRFTGDVVLQNGLLRLLYDTTDQITRLYVYNGQWYQVGRPTFGSTDAATWLATHLEITRLSSEELCWRELRQRSVANEGAAVEYSLRRGSYFIRCRLVNGAVAVSSGKGIRLYSGGDDYFRFVYNSLRVSDQALAGEDLLQDIYYNFAACFYPSAGRPFLCGFAYGTPAPAKQPYAFDAQHSLAQSGLCSVASTYLFWLWATPIEAASLFGEAEGGLGGGADAVADATASGGYVARLDASSEYCSFAVTGTDLPAGRYAVAARVKTASSGTTKEFRVGAYAAGAWKTGYKDYGPNNIGSAWTYTDVALVYYDHDGATDFSVRAEKITSQAYDWRVDYLLLLPIYSTATYSFPQDVGLQCLANISQELCLVGSGAYASST